jgi:ActR/RegA family two-component response regulator
MRLVLCDDNRIFCEALAVALEARGHRALAIATTAAESIAAVARHQPDACLLDLRFNNGEDGLAAARLIRDRYPQTAVLVVSGRADNATSLAAEKIGVAGVFGKDKELDHIAAALDVIAAARSAPATGPPEPGELAGTGLIVDMGRKVRIKSVTVTFGTVPGADVSIMVGDHDILAAATLPTFTAVATADGVGGRRTFGATQAVRGRYVLIWFTKLPLVSLVKYEAEIFNAVFRGWR